MLKSYFKIAVRNLLKQRFYSIINILGLSVGLMACLLIALFVADELSYDTYNKNADRIYRTDLYGRLGGQESHYAVAPAPMARTLADVYPEIENTVRFRGMGDFTIQQGENTYKETRIIFADSSLFDVFTIPLLYGNPATALRKPNTMVISKATAKKYFGSQWERDVPIGKTLLVGREKIAYQVTGIFDKIPDNAHFHFALFLSLASLDESREDMWLNNNFNTYLLLQEGTDVGELEAKINQTVDTYVAPQIQQFSGASMEEFRAAGNTFEYSLMPLTDIHLHSNLGAEFEANSDIAYVYIFSVIAFFILLIACVNFMNLSTARSSGRAKEVGVRKVLGSDRRQLIIQFLIEAVLISFLSLAIAIILSEALLPFFNTLSGKHLSTNYIEHWYLMPTLLATAGLVGLLAGSYPAFFLSGFSPATVLKGKLATGMKSNWLRSSLVVLQFGISITLIVSTVVVYQQLNHIQNMKLGYDKEHVVVLNNTYSLDKQTEAFKNEALRNPDILSVTVSGYLPANTISSNSSYIFPGNNPDSEYGTSLPWWSVDYDYIKTMGMEMAEGRNFSREFATDSTAIVINEAAWRFFDFDKDPDKGIGKMLSDFGKTPKDVKSYKVIGVVRDFHYATMHQEIMPMVMILDDNASAMSFRIKGNEVPNTIAALEAQWKRFAPGVPFEYSFMDERFSGMYRSEQQVGQIFTVCCSLAILIACLGLFGLAAYTAEQRTKEIGIRKVLGASVWSVVMMFSKEFTRLVVIALLVAIPIAYFAMNRWLEDFAYRISIGPAVFIIAGVLALLLAWITVSFQSFRAANNDPVKSLRSE